MGIQEAYFEFDLDSIREIISGGQSLLSAKLSLFYHYINEGSELDKHIMDRILVFCNELQRHGKKNI
jgi:hypothetical protein